MLALSFTRRAISSKQWPQTAPGLIAALSAADFVAFDMELTGLFKNTERHIGIEQCYSAHREGAGTFMPVQIGLCAARREGNHWQLTPASIYVWPGEDRFFGLTSQTASFLIKNGFDFNQWIEGGVGWIRPEDEKQRKDQIQARINEVENIKQTTKAASTPSSSSTTPVRKAMEIPDNVDVEAYKKTTALIREWLDSPSTEALEIPMSNAYERLVMHTAISQEFPSVYSYSSKRDDQRLLCVYKNQDEIYDEQLTTLRGEIAKIDELVGVRALFDVIGKHKKILVGHNCFYDMVHLFQSFYTDLPEDVQDFKHQWLQLFPASLDTKHLAETHEALVPLSPPVTLKNLCDFMATKSAETKPFTFEVRSDDYDLGEVYLPFMSNAKDGSPDLSHDAGYDALLTSLVLLFQVHHILEKKHIPAHEVAWRHTDDAKHRLEDILNLSINRIRLVKSQPNMINLIGFDEADMRRHFYMSQFPSNWKKWEILKVWSPVWVNVSHVDDTSCWVICRNDEDVDNIKLIFKMLENPQFKLQTYDEYKQQRKEGTLQRPQATMKM